MIGMAHVVAEFSLVWLTIILAASLLCSAAYPLYKRLIRGYSPNTRAIAVLIYGTMPILTAVLVVLLMLQPALSEILIVSHCHGNDCGSHTPDMAMFAVGAVQMSLATLIIMGFILMCYRSMRANKRYLAELDALSITSVDKRFKTVDSNELFAWCGGLWQPKVYLSRGLLQRLTERQLDVVLAHEHTHVARRDNLRRTALHWATVLWPGRIKAVIRNDFTHASEQACDMEAAIKVDDSALVAFVIGMLSDLTDKQSHVSRSAFTADGWVERLQALSIARPSEPSFIYICLLITVFWLVNMLVLTNLAHLVLEWVIR